MLAGATGKFYLPGCTCLLSLANTLMTEFLKTVTDAINSCDSVQGVQDILTTAECDESIDDATWYKIEDEGHKRMNQLEYAVTSNK